MKNMLLCLFSAMLLLFSLPSAKAGFVVKRQVATVIKERQASSVKVAPRWLRYRRHHDEWQMESWHPYYPFAYGGWVGFSSLIFGALGLFWGGFAVAAILFGFWGMGRRHKNKGMAIAGLVLGLFAIALSIFTTFNGFPIF